MPGLPSGVMQFPLQAIHVIQDRHCCLVVYCKASDIANLSKAMSTRYMTLTWVIEDHWSKSWKCLKTYNNPCFWGGGSCKTCQHHFTRFSWSQVVPGIPSCERWGNAVDDLSTISHQPIPHSFCPHVCPCGMWNPYRIVQSFKQKVTSSP